MVSGITSAAPIGKFLDGNLPATTPAGSGPVTWGITPAFPNLSFNDPLVITMHPNENRMFVASRGGVIHQFVNDANVSAKTLVADLSDRTAVVWDGGFLGLAFHPEFGQAGSPNRNYVYAYYTAKGPNGESGPNQFAGFACPTTGTFYGTYLRLSRFTFQDGTYILDPSSELQMINLRLYEETHRGGGLTFAKDGYLYLTIGDQARHLTAQNIVDNFEGGVIRIDVDQNSATSHAPRRKMGVHAGESDEFTGVGYYVPNDNPWLSTSSALFEEFWEIGHRAPHRMTMDQETGELWIGEIGQGSREEITVVKKATNAGWPVYEGNLYHNIGNCGSNTTDIGLGTYNGPVVDFLRSESNALIGGYVYRGNNHPTLVGKYICGGYSQNRIFVVTRNAQGTGTKEEITSFTPGQLATFGQDHDGEIYLGGLGNNVKLYTLQSSGTGGQAPQFLSQTGAFKNVQTLEPEDGVIPYDMVEPFWSDGAEKFRWLAIPNDGSHNTAAEQIQYSENGNWGFPKGAALIKHFELGGKRLETRFEVRGDDNAYYYLTYKWNSAGTDAELLDGSLDETITVGGVSQVWHYPSRSECQSCHQQAAGSVLGLKTRYLNKAMTYPGTGITANQLVSLSSVGILDANITDANVGALQSLAAKDDQSRPLVDRARSYLDMNCSYCHQPGTGNRAGFDLRYTTSLNDQNLIYGALLDDLGINGASAITPQVVPKSMVHYRMDQAGTNQAMPPLGKNKVDQAGVQLIADWINSLQAGQNPVAANGTGLTGTYFNNINLTAEVLQVVDETISFNWGSAAPLNSMGADTYSIRWEGKIEAPTTGSFTFYTNSDDGIRLWIDNVLVIDKWIDQPATEWEGQINLIQGREYDIKVEYFENGGLASVQLSWAGPAVTKQIVPKQYLYPVGASTCSDPVVSASKQDETCGQNDGAITFTFSDDPDQTMIAFSIDGGQSFPYTSADDAGSFSINNLGAGTYDLRAQWVNGDCPVDLADVTITNGGGNCPEPVAGNGTGLRGTYFNNSDFTNQALERIDPTIDFTWGSGSPDPSIGNDTYSARWEGQVEAPSTGTFTFYTRTDDGVRLWVNDVLVIDKWILQSPTEWTGTIDLIEGKEYPIKMEFYENGGGAVAQLSWSTAGLSKQIVPTAYLYPASVTACSDPVVTSTSQDPLCDQNDGSITFTFSDDPTQSQISFSINGGQSYPYSAADNAGSFTVNNLAPGTYDLRARWSNGDCPVDLADATLTNQDNNCGGPITGTGTGLRGTYFDNIDFTNQVLERVDPTINFNWGTGSPDNSIGVNTFSIRWEGEIQAPLDGNYTFHTTTDDGVRLWIDGTLVIDKWIDQAPRKWTGNFSMQQGAKYDIKMEYYENGGGAVAQFRWSASGVSEDIIPQEYLYPAAITPPPSCTAPIASAAKSDPTCDQDNGSITFTFPDNSGRTNIEFSLDGGNSYPYNVLDNTGSTTISNLAPGTYDLWVRWGNDECPTDMPDLTLSTDNSNCQDLCDNTLYSDDFEQNWGIWIDGGSDASRGRYGQYVNSGIRCIRLRDNDPNSSFITTQALDLSGFQSLQVNFSYMTNSMDNSNEDFWLQLSTDGGNTFSTQEEWNLNDEFVNEQRYNESVTIQGPFTANTRLRFRCDASGNADRVFLDDISIVGCNPASFQEVLPENTYVEGCENGEVMEHSVTELLTRPVPTPDAQSQRDKVVLDWPMSEQEPFIGKIHIQRAEEKGDFFETIGEIPAFETNRQPTSFVDEEPLPTSAVYRLKWVGADGIVGFSSNTAVQRLSDAAQLVVYPNPVEKNASVVVDAILPQTGDVFLILYNLQGKIVQQQQGYAEGLTYKVEMSTRALPKGAYILKVRRGDWHQSTRVVVQ